MKLTPKQLAQAKHWREKKVPWDRIAARFGCSTCTVRRPLDPEFRERRNAQIRANKPNYEGDGASPERRPIIPAELLVDQQARANARLTISQALFGDPPPGQSALDRLRLEGRYA